MNRVDVKKEFAFYCTFARHKYYIDYDSLKSGFESIFDCCIYDLKFEIGKIYLKISFKIKKYNNLETILNSLRYFDYIPYEIKKHKIKNHLIFCILFDPIWNCCNFYSKIFKKTEKNTVRSTGELFININGEYYNMDDFGKKMGIDEFVLLTKKLTKRKILTEKTLTTKN